MDIAASVAAASAAAGGVGGLQGVATLEGGSLNRSLLDGLGASAVAAAAAAAAGGREGARPPSAFAAPHPLEIQQKRYLHEVERQELSRAAAAFGGHAALCMKTERELCAMTQRLPGLSSSFCGLQTLMGLDDQILVEEYLGREKPEIEGGPMLTVHDRIERAMGI